MKIQGGSIWGRGNSKGNAWRVNDIGVLQEQQEDSMSEVEEAGRRLEVTVAVTSRSSSHSTLQTKLPA